jgi:hypothetical protein
MTPRAKEYQHESRWEFDRNEHVVRYIRFGMDKERGTPHRVMIQFEIEIGDECHAIVRYDNAHGTFHRHLPGQPVPLDGRVDLSHIQRKDWIDYAFREIKARYLEWEQELGVPSTKVESNPANEGVRRK